MSFGILYQDGGSVVTNLSTIAYYVDEFVKELGLQKLNIDESRLTSVAAALLRPDFPHIDGFEKASPFKKAANFFVWFVAEKPILEPLPLAKIGEDLAKINNHQNVILAYYMAIECLQNAKIYRGNTDIISLDNKIKVSKHYFCDFVEAFSAATPNHHFKIASLIFEQLSYKANPLASYPEVV